MQSSHHLAELTQKTLTHFLGISRFQGFTTRHHSCVIAGKDTIALFLLPNWWW